MGYAKDRVHCGEEETAGGGGEQAFAAIALLAEMAATTRPAAAAATVHFRAKPWAPKHVRDLSANPVRRK